MKIREFLLGGDDDIWFDVEDNTSFSYKNRMGRMLESPYKKFEKGDMITVKIQGEDIKREFKTIGEEVFVRGKNVYDIEEFCPNHDVRKCRDEKNQENYCPMCEK